MDRCPGNWSRNYHAKAAVYNILNFMWSTIVSIVTAIVHVKPAYAIFFYQRCQLRFCLINSTEIEIKFVQTPETLSKQR